MSYLTNMDVWRIAIVWAIFAAAAAAYLRYSTKLAKRIDTLDPDLWSRLNWWNFKANPYYGPQRGPRLERLIFFGPGKDRPVDAEFDHLLSVSRWSAFACLVTWIIALIVTSRAGANLGFDA